MEQITINEQIFEIYRQTGKTQIKYIDESTGLDINAEMLRMEIEPRNQYISVKWRVEVSANDVLVHTYTKEIVTPASHFEGFENSILGTILKAGIINGYFRFALENTLRVIELETGNLITEQPQTDEN
jgi:hypothetical protein